MADAEAPLKDYRNFKDGFVALDLELDQLNGSGVLAHDAIRYIIENRKIPLALGCIVLVSIDLFGLALGIWTANCAIGQKGGIRDRKELAIYGRLNRPKKASEK